MATVPFHFPQVWVLLFHGCPALGQQVRETLLQAPTGFYLAAETDNSGALAELLATRSIDAVLLVLDLTAPTAWRSMQQFQPYSSTMGVVVVGREVTVDFAVKTMGCGVRGYLDYDAPAEELWLALQTVSQGGLWYNAAPAARIRERFVEPCARFSCEEWQVARLVASGEENHEIAEALGLSVKSVERKLNSIKEKLELRNRTELASWFFTNGHATPAVEEEVGGSRAV